MFSLPRLDLIACQVQVEISCRVMKRTRITFLGFKAVQVLVLTNVQCDEQGPPCMNCQVRDLWCTPSAKQGGKLTDRALPENIEHFSPIDASATSSRAMELELLHWWSTDTYRSFSFRPGDSEIWQITLIRDALENPFLLDIIFAITSLHIALTGPSTKTSTYRLAALRYHNTAIKAFQQHDLSMTAFNSQATFAFTLVNLALVVALPQVFPEVSSPAFNTTITTSITDNLVTMFRTLQGVLSVYSSSHTWLLLGAFRPLLRSSDLTSLDDKKLNPLLGGALERLRATSNEFHLSQTMERSILETAIVAEYQGNISAIDELRICFLLLPTQGVTVCFRWLTKIEHAFVEAIASRRPVSLLITLHWAILLDKLGTGRWWARAAGQLLATELSRLLLDLRPEWKDAISDVLQMLSSESLDYVVRD